MGILHSYIDEILSDNSNFEIALSIIEKEMGMITPAFSEEIKEWHEEFWTHEVS